MGLNFYFRFRYLLVLVFINAVNSKGIPCPSQICRCDTTSISCDGTGQTNVTLKFEHNGWDKFGSTLTRLHLHNLILTPLHNITDLFPLLNSVMMLNVTLEGFDVTAMNKLSKQITELTVYTPGLTYVPLEMQEFTQLTSLTLDDNQISDLNNLTIFNKNPSLKKLYFEYNQISNINPFFQLNDIEHLDLRGNKICDHQQIPYALIPHEQTLEYLDLSQNCLSYIPDFIFMKQLEVLWLNLNRISNATDVDFPSSITILYLDHNPLEKLPSGVSKLPNIFRLHANDMKLTSIDTFEFPSALRYLYLSHNNIDAITRLRFSNGTNTLQLLDLSGNPLETIQNGAFKELSQLRILQLSNTKLMRLPLELRHLAILKTLEMENIPTLVCTCAEAALDKWFNTTSLKLTGQCNGDNISTFFSHLVAQCPIIANSTSGSLMGKTTNGPIMGSIITGSMIGITTPGSLIGNATTTSLMENTTSGSMIVNTSSGSLMVNTTIGSMMGNTTNG